jgi:formylglycine-generating enzyme required for sulfatase activity
MKYEITQQQYVDFLNCLNSTQASNRYSTTSSGSRYGISLNSGIFSTSNPFVACNFLSWSDGTAYLDWSGLRPMTELEFEKACRGPLTPVPLEYAWGNTSVQGLPMSLSNSGANNENIATNFSTSLGNAITNQNSGSIGGPVRVGIFAGNVLNTMRVTAGATYYGIMEMTANVEERPVTVGNPQGRQFTGLHGNGLLDVSGNADALNWPGITAVGGGFRGGRWVDGIIYTRVSDRFRAALININRNSGIGGRGVRSAP